MILNYIISLDWLQFRCSGFLRTNSEFVRVVKMDINSRFFNEVYEVFAGNERLAVVQYKPKFQHEDQYMSLIKFQNRLLYKDTLKNNVEIVLDALGLSIVAFSRIDLACDFVQFKNKWHPPHFIKSFIANNVIMKGKFKGALFFESNEEIEYQTLQIGRHSSELTAKLYNKTRELQQQKDKPYIREMHKYLSNNDNWDVWRFEIKLTTDALKMASTSTGEVVCPATWSWWDREEWKNLFFSVFNSKFVFFKNAHKSVKSRNERLVLFDRDDILYKISIKNDNSDTTRKHIIFAKMLYNLDKEMRTINKEFLPTIQELSKAYIREHGIYRLDDDKFLQQGKYHFDR